MNTKVVVDKSKCVGHAQCNATAPSVYPLDDDGYVEITEVALDGDRVAAARNGAAACPERAIAVTSAE